ncbi:MAG TPA: hypothetical protein VGC39_02515 [Candidatus Methylacidiphilales bacterium]
MSSEPQLPVSLTEPLVIDPARTVEADAVAQEIGHGHDHAHCHGRGHGGVSGMNWTDPEFLSVLVTLVFMLLGGFGTWLGLPAGLAPWFFLVAYLAGGWHGTIHGLRSLL